MTKSTRNLLIVFGILLAALAYQVFFTDAYDGIFGFRSGGASTSPEAPPVVETTTPSSEPAGSESTTSAVTPPSEQPSGDDEPEIIADSTDGAAVADRSDEEASEHAETTDEAEDEAGATGETTAPTTESDARFRSEQLLRALPDENPFRSVTERPSALFDPSTAGPAIPLSPSASASVLENGDLVEGEETGETPDGVEPTETTEVGPVTPGTGVAPSTSHTPRRVHTAPVLRLQTPVPSVALTAPEFAPLFSSLAPAPLIRTTRQAVVVTADQLPTSLPPAPLVQFAQPTSRAPLVLSQRVAPPVVPYFTDLAIYPVIAFTADNRHADPASTPRAARIRNLGAYFDEIDLTFTGTARGSVTVGVFRSTLTLGPVVLAVGQTLPETEITLTRLTTTEAEFTLGEQTRVLTLNLRW